MLDNLGWNRFERWEVPQEFEAFEQHEDGQAAFWSTRVLVGPFDFFRSRGEGGLEILECQRSRKSRVRSTFNARHSTELPQGRVGLGTQPIRCRPVAAQTSVLD